jgi:hypothetical protein
MDKEAGLALVSHYVAEALQADIDQQECSGYVVDVVDSGPYWVLIEASDGKRYRVLVVPA